LKGWPILGIAIVQIILLLAHWFLYSTWVALGWPMGHEALVVLRGTLLALSFLFVVAALLGFRLNNFVVSRLALVSSVWLGLLNFLFFGAWVAWGVDLVLRFVLPGSAHLAVRPWLATALPSCVSANSNSVPPLTGCAGRTTMRALMLGRL